MDEKKIKPKKMHERKTLEGKTHLGKKKRSRLAILAMAVPVIIIACLLFAASGALHGALNATGAGQQGVAQNNPALSAGGIDRSTYNLPAGVFSELPAIPKDFNKIISLTHQNLFTNYGFFSPEYYLQPEFYP